MAREDYQVFYTRLPKELLGKVRRRAGELSDERGKYVSANQVVIEVLQQALNSKGKGKKKRG